jgi:hypothetical protein
MFSIEEVSVEMSLSAQDAERSGYSASEELGKEMLQQTFAGRDRAA